MAGNPFPEWLADVAADPVTVRPDDISAEARCNLWSFSLATEPLACVTPDDVAEFAAAVAVARRGFLSELRAEPMRLYWWHDRQAGHLCFSLVSESHGCLPFGCEWTPASLAEIATEWLQSPHISGIPWAELTPVALDEPIREPTPTVLPVWSVRVP